MSTASPAMNDAAMRAARWLSRSITSTSTSDRRRRSTGAVRSGGALAAGEVRELGQVGQERELDDAGGTVAVLGDDQFGDALVRAVVVVDLVTVDEADEVRVLLDRAALTQVGELRPLVGARLRLPRQLRQGHDRHVEFL